MEEACAHASQEKDNTTQCLLKNVSESIVSNQPSQISLGRGLETESLETTDTPEAEVTSDLFEEPIAFSYPVLDPGHSSSADLPEKVLKGRDLFLPKACEDDSDAQLESDSSLSSPFHDYSFDSQPEFSHPSQLLERSGSIYQASYSSGFSHFPCKRGRGRPRKDPFSVVTKKASRGRGLGQRGRPALLTYKQTWLSSLQNLRSMDTNDPADSEDGTSATRTIGLTLSDGASTSSSDQALVISGAATASCEDATESQGSGRICAFCACVEKSLLGQGELYKFEATVDFTPSKRLLKSRRGSSETEEQNREKSPKHLTWRRPRGVFKGSSRERSRSPRQQSFGDEDSSVLTLTDELALVGFSEDVEVATVFDESGAVWAHYCCAVWSENVEQTEGRLQYVDRAVFSGLSQKCGYCRRYGASLACRSPRCTKKFHFPCASAGNCFQDLKTLSLLCPDHVGQAEVIAGNDAFCIQCNELGNVAEQLFCTSCGQHYHGNCLCPPVEIKPIVRAGWQCPNCKICQTCRFYSHPQKGALLSTIHSVLSKQPGDDIKMLVCDTCDKGYHTFCLKPAMTTIPKNGWKCKNCRICSDCGARTPGNGPSSRWHLNYSVCDSCYQQRNKGLCCPLCGKAYRHFQHKSMMVLCTSCKKQVHSECDSAIDSNLLQRVRQGDNIDYVCQVCKESDSTAEMESFALTAPSGTDESMESFTLTKADSDLNLKDNPMLTEATLTTASSQESLCYDDSNSSVDYDTDKTYVPHRDDLYGHKLFISRKKLSSSRTRSRGLGSGEKRRHRPISLGEKRRGPKMKVKTSPGLCIPTNASTPTTPVLAVTQINEALPRVSTPPCLSNINTTSPSSTTQLQQQPGSAEKKEKDDDDDGDDHPSTILLASSKDRFVMDQDVCKSCGSFGKGDEAKMIVCTQCGQCYHPYCVSVKVTKVILKKGWRCLDCTVCEGCGGPDDEGRLLLCDDCDISYHTYCLQPPLKYVPKGNWKCKWCVRCLYCGSTSPGIGCQWMSNYTKCGPCHSKQSCPVCSRHYREEELIIQCVHCDRWLHCMCDGLRNEDEAELAADYGYHCLFCRPKTGKSGPLPPPPPPPPPPMEEDIKMASPPASIFQEPEQPRQYLIDGVYLLASGMQQIQSQIIPLPKIKRRRPPKFPCGARTPRIYSMDGDDSFDKDDELKFDSLEPGELPSAAMGSELTPEEEAKLAKMKRQRKQLGMGVGGFMIRQMTRKFNKRQTSIEEHGDETILGGEVETSLLQDKPKKRPRKSRKGKLEESFPGYLQEAFFGLELLNSSKYNPVASQDMLHSGSDSDTPNHSSSLPSSPSPMPSTGSAVIPSASVGIESDAKEVGGEGVGDMILPGDGQRQATPLSTSQQGSEGNDLEEGDTDFFPADVEKDILKLFGDMDNELETGPDTSKDKGEELSEKEGDQDNLEKIFNSKSIDVDRMLSEGLMQFDGVEDIFKGVLKSEEEAHPQQGSGMAGPSHIGMQTHPGAVSSVRVGPQGEMMRPSHAPGPEDSPNQEIPPFNIPPMFPSLSSPEMATGMTGISQTMSPWTANPAADEDDNVGGSSKRSILKWGADEALGSNATISAVLYVNINHPNLRKDFPEWSERAKQIAKLWRKLKPEEKAPYLAKARKNRTSHRVQKAQKQVSQELKRRQEAQMLQDIEAMPPPPAPPPLPGQLSAGGDPFTQPSGPHDPPEALSPSMRNPLHSPGGPGSSPFHRWGDDPFHKSPTMDHSPDGFSPSGTHSRQGAGAQTHESFVFSPGTPKHEPCALSPGAPRPRLQHQSIEQFVRGPGSQGLSPVSSPLPLDDPYSKAPLTPRIFPVLLGPLARMKQEEHTGTTQPHDPYAFPPTTPRAATPQEEGFHGPLRHPHSAPDSYPPGASAAMQSGIPRPSSESGDLFHGVPSATLADNFGPPSAPSSTHASPVHSMASTPPRPGQYALSPGGSGMTSPMRHPDACFSPEGFKSPHLQRSNSLPHSYQGGPPRLPMDPSLSRSMSDVSAEHFQTRMMPPQDPALISRRHKLGPQGPYSWSFSLAPPSVGASGPGSGEAALGSLGSGGGGAPTPHQQLREILGHQTKLRMQQKAAQQMGQGHPLHHQWMQQQEAAMGPGASGLPPSSMMPRLPGALPVFRDGRAGPPCLPPDHWSLEPRMVRPPNPSHFPQEAPERFSPRGQQCDAGIMRFTVPQHLQRPSSVLPVLPPGGLPKPPTEAFQQTPQQVSTILPELGRPHDDEVFHHLEGQRSQVLSHPVTKQGEQVAIAVERGGQVRAGSVETGPLHLAGDKELKPSISSEDDKPEDDDLLSADGTFDILKYADPELDLDDPNLIDSLDLIDDPKASSGEGEGEDKKDEDKSERKKTLNRAAEGTIKTDTDSDGEGKEETARTRDFQSQFLEFSQRRQHQIDTGDGSAAAQMGDADKGGTKSVSARAGQSIMDGSAEGSKMAGSDPSVVSGAIQSMLQRPPFIQGLSSVLTGPASCTQQLSPQNGAVPGPSGLPSPKVSHSPRSSQPSPRTPGIQSPYSQVICGRHSASPHSQPVTPVGQMSPFSQHGSGQSPFSPPISSAQSPFGVGTGTPVSAPHSPYTLQGPSRTMSPFTMAVGGGQVITSQPGPLQPLSHPQQPQPQQMLASRATITPTNQYNQGSYSQPLGAHGAPPRGTTLTPTPSSILYGQSAANQHALRPQGPPRTFPSGQDLTGEEMGVGEQRLSHLSLQQQIIQKPRFSGTATALRAQLPPTSSHPSLQHHLAQGQRTPFPPSSGLCIQSPGARPPGLPAGVSGSEQKTLLDELLEQEKQEQKKQAEQQALLHRPGQGTDVIMTAAPLPGMHPQQHPGLSPHGMPPRLGKPEGSWMGAPRHSGPGDLSPGQPFSPGYGQRLSNQPVGPHGPMPPFTSPPMQQAQSGPPMMPLPPPQPPVPKSELGPSVEYDRQVMQYEDWLSKQTQYLDIQVKTLEQQIQKQKRAKKTIQARQRQARKNNQELNPKDAQELERVAAEQSEIQKQLETQRKQSRQHQVVVQEFYNKQKEFATSCPSPMGMSRPVVSTYGPAAPPVPLVSSPTTVNPIPAGIMQPRVPGSPSSIRMSPTARQEYDAYMQSRLRLAAHSPRPRAPTTIQLGDNNPFSETFQVREQLIKKQHVPGMPPLSPSETPVNSPGSQPSVTSTAAQSPAATAAPGPVGVVRHPSPQTVEAGRPMQQFLGGRCLDSGTRFMRPPGPFGDGGARVEGPRQPAYSPGLHMDPPRMPFAQSMPLPPGPGFGHPGLSAPHGGAGDMGSVPAQPPAKEKPKKRRKKKKAEDIDSAQSQPLPPSMPSQSMLSSGTQSTESRTGTSGAGLHKPPEFPIKPQSETDRRILEILSNTAALASKEGPQPATKGGNSKSARSKSPAASSAGSHKSLADKSSEGEHSNTSASDASGDGGLQSALGSLPRPLDSISSQMGHSATLLSSVVSSAAVQTTTSVPCNMPSETTSEPTGISYQQRSSLLGPGSHQGFSPSGVHQTGSGHPFLSVSGASPHNITSGSMTMGTRTIMSHSSGHPANIPRGSFHPHLAPTVQQLQDAVRHPSHMMRFPLGLSVSMAQSPNLIRPPQSLPSLAYEGSTCTVAQSGLVKSEEPSPCLSLNLPSAAQPGIPLPSTPDSQSPQHVLSHEVVPSTSSTSITPNVLSSAPVQENVVQQPAIEVRPEPSEGPEEHAGECKTACDDGIHCGTDSEEDSLKKKICDEICSEKVCDDDIHSRKSDKKNSVEKTCDDKKHSGTDDQREISEKKYCDDGIHCGTDDEDEKFEKKICDDGAHCETDNAMEKSQKKFCTDRIHYGTDDEKGTSGQKVCTGGMHCGTGDEEKKNFHGEVSNFKQNIQTSHGIIQCGAEVGESKKKQVYSDRILCWTDGEIGKYPKKVYCGSNEKEEMPKREVCNVDNLCGTDDNKGTPQKKVCNDGIHCGTDDEEETPQKTVCTDGIHCGTDDEEESSQKKVCSDGIHCGTDDEEETPQKIVCSDGIHCGTDDEEETTKKTVCSDGIHCGTDDEEETPQKIVCSDGIHCGTDDEEETTKKTVCSDGIHCGTDDEEERSQNKVCSDGIHCGTDDEEESSQNKVCSDGIHCGTDDEEEITQKNVCSDGIHCGTDDEEESSQNKVCNDGIHCGTGDEEESSQNKVCSDGIHCGTDDEEESSQKKVCSDGIHCGTDDEEESSQKKVCSDGIHCGTDDEEESSQKNVCSDGIHCGTDDEEEAGKETSESKPSNSELAIASTPVNDASQPNLPPTVSKADMPPSTRSDHTEGSENSLDFSTGQIIDPAKQSLQTGIGLPHSTREQDDADSQLQASTGGSEQGFSSVTASLPASPIPEAQPSSPPTSESKSSRTATSTSLRRQLMAVGFDAVEGSDDAHLLASSQSSESRVSAADGSGSVQHAVSGQAPVQGQSDAFTASAAFSVCNVTTTVEEKQLSLVPASSGFSTVLSSAAPVYAGPQTMATSICAETLASAVSVSAGSHVSRMSSRPISTASSSNVESPAVTMNISEDSSAVTANYSNGHSSVTTSFHSFTSVAEPQSELAAVSSHSGSPNLTSLPLTASTSISSCDATIFANSAADILSHSNQLSRAGMATSVVQSCTDLSKAAYLTTSISANTDISAVTTVTASGLHLRPHLSPLLVGDSMHYPHDHPLAGQPRPPLDMLAHVSQSALSSAGASLPTSLSSAQSSPPAQSSQLSPDVMRGCFPRHLPQHMAQQVMSTTASSTSQHSPTLVYGQEGAFIPRHIFPGPGIGPRFRGMALTGEYPQGRGIMSPPSISPSSPSTRSQRPQFPPYHTTDMMHPNMPPRAMGPRPLLPPEIISRPSSADTHQGMMPPHMQGYGHLPPHNQAMMNRAPYSIHPPLSSGAMEFSPRPHANMSLAGFPGHRMPAGGHQSAHSPSSTSSLRLQGACPGFPPDPRMMSPEAHRLMSQGDPRMAANIHMFAEQQRLGMMRQRHPMMPPGPGGFGPHQHHPQPRHPMFSDEGIEQYHPLHPHPRSTPPANLPDAVHMSVSQSALPSGLPSTLRHPFPEVVSLAPSCSIGPMMSSTGTLESDLKGLDIVVNQPGMPGSILIKSEPGLESSDIGERESAGRDLELDQRAKNNALLKQLLSKQEQAAFRGEMHPPSTPDSEESLPQLTPDQQRQLELIDMMPLCKETESSTDPSDWDTKSAEEREQIQELRKQEYETKRKQYEAVRRKRKGSSTVPGLESSGAPQPKVKKRRTKSVAAPSDSNSLGPSDLSEPVSVKKRGRRNKNRESKLEQRESELEFMAETFLQQLHSLPSVSLREPDITLMYSVVPVKGAPNITDVSSLHGTFGQSYLDSDFDMYHSLSFPPPPPTLQPTPSSKINKMESGNKELQLSPVTCAAGPAITTTVVTSPTTPPTPVPILPIEAGPFALPAHPRIEVKSEPLRDTPDTIISSSSPECGFEEKEADFSSLRPIDPASPGGLVDDKYSPTVPLLHPIPTYPSSKAQRRESIDIKPPTAILPPSPIITSSQLGPMDTSLPTSAHLSAKEETLIPTPPETPNLDLTVKLPTITSGLAHPFINPSLDQKVSVTLTLSANAAEDIGGVISAIADLLKIAVPPTYEITRTPSPEMFKLNLTHKEDVINIQALMRTKPTFCGHCHVVLINSGIRKHKTELPSTLVSDEMDPDDDEVTFCSMNCMNQFLQTAPQLEDLEEDEDNSNSASTSTIIMEQGEEQDHKVDKMELDSEATRSEPQLSEAGSPKRSVPITEALSISTSSPALSASASATTQPGTPTTPTAGPSTFSSPATSPTQSALMSPGTRTVPLGSPHHPLLSPTLRVKEERSGKRHRRSSSTASQDGYIVKPMTKRWRDERWRRWDCSFTPSKLPDISAKELNELWDSLGMILKPANLPSDQRICSFCQGIGEGDPDGPSRLLNMNVDKWVHLNCALWSYEVYETCNGALMNVDVAHSRGLTTECMVCRKMGATLGCFKARCANSYHLPCARLKGCIFFQDKTIFCGTHTNVPKPYADAELLSLEVRRRVYINRDEEKQVASIVCSLIHPDEGHHALRIGSLILHSIGQLLPHQIQTNKFNTKDFIYPVGFRVTRLYWSHRSLYKRCRYLCSIAENHGSPEFIVCIKEEGHADMTFRDSSAKGVWMNIFQPLKLMRKNADMVKMFPEFMCMEELFGLNEPAIIRVLESLPGADLLQNYSFKFGRSPLIEMPPAINPTGCARTEPKLRTHFRRPHTLHSSNSRSLPSTVTSVTGDINSPYMKQFVHSKSQQYRRLKTEWKNLVYLGRSRIQGLGLYAARDLEKHTMVIEYIGDLIRNEVANRREKEYDDQNRGVYMFRIDNDTVIDATMAGGPARYINHSCSPNCAAEVVHFEKESKIIIITGRRIPKGEELTYDYKFDFEDDQHKIPCLCGADHCRKWMN